SEHRVGEVVARFQRSIENGEKALRFFFQSGMAVGLTDKFAQQAFGIELWAFRVNLDAWQRYEFPIPEAVGFGGYFADARNGLAIHHRQVAEEQLVSCVRPLVVNG